MVPSRLLSLALFSSALVAAVWWQRRRHGITATVVKHPRAASPAEVPWVDVA